MALKIAGGEKSRDLHALQGSSTVPFSVVIVEALQPWNSMSDQAVVKTFYQGDMALQFSSIGSILDPAADLIGQPLDLALSGGVIGPIAEQVPS